MARRAELFRVPDGMEERAWKDAEPWLQKVPGLDLEAQRTRLLSGQDTLWCAILLEGKRPAAWLASDCMGVVITRITEKPPPSLAKPFPPGGRSLTVHLASGVLIQSWIASAVERITRYAKDEHCRQLFVQARQGWREYATRFYSREFEAVGYSRDRPRRILGKRPHYGRRNQPGHYLLMKPVERMTKEHYNSGSVCHFEERA